MLLNATLNLYVSENTLLMSYRVPDTVLCSHFLVIDTFWCHDVTNGETILDYAPCTARTGVFIRSYGIVNDSAER